MLHKTFKGNVILFFEIFNTELIIITQYSKVLLTLK
jgi:hypothetical protein